MSFYITNGYYFITLKSNGAIRKVSGEEGAYAPLSKEEAERILKEAPAKTKGYYIVPVKNNDAWRESSVNGQRKKVTSAVRKIVYAKDQGRCYLCGKPVDEEAFEVEHKIPVAKGGTNNLDNMYVACHECNTMKNSMFFDDFMQKITEIVRFQAQGQVIADSQAASAC